MSRDRSERGEPCGPPPPADPFVASQTILEALPVGIWTTDATGRILYQNPAARRILPIDQARPLGTFAPKAWAWNSLRPVRPEELVWQHVFVRGEPLLDHVVCIESSSGELRNVILSAVPIAGAGAETALVVIVGVDCSALITTQDHLRRTVSLLRTTLESVTNGVLVIDTAGRIVVHNRIFADMWRLPSDILDLGDDNRALAAALEQLKDPKTFLERVRDLYAKPLEQSFDVLELKDGRVLERYSVPQLLDGRPIGRVWSFWDVTERKREEAALQSALDAERQARAEAVAARERLAILANVSEALETAFENPAAIEVAARAVVPQFADWCILDAIDSDQGLQRVAVAHSDSEDDSIGRELERWTPTPHAAKGPAAVLRTAVPELYESVTDDDLEASGESPERLAVLRALRPLSAIVVPLAARGHLLGTLTFVTASSGRRYGPADLAFALQLAGRMAVSLDNALLYQHARQALAARDDVLSVVSHDLRNPIAAIHAGASTMLRRLSTGAPPEPLQRRSLELIQRTALRMDRLIEDLLDASRIEAHELRLSSSPQDTGRLIGEVVEIEQLLAAKKSIALSVSVAEPLPLVLGDRDRLHQVLANLIGNAIKFTPEGGSIAAGAASLGDAVCFSVTDTGPGIPEGDLPHVFDRFWQARSTAGFGVGLGLAICKGIVEAHGGRIWATSRPGGGATFSFTIPAAGAGRAREAA